MSDESIKSILELPSPKTHKQLMQVNGTLSYFRRFLPDFAALSASFTNLLKKSNKEKFVWTEEAEADFQRIKKIITQTPVLKLFDSNLPTELRCDCSDLGASGVLLQLHEEKKWYPVMYCSKKLNTTQRNYTTTHKELLAIIYSVARFEQYLYNIKFTIITDHNSLIFIQTATKYRCIYLDIQLLFIRFNLQRKQLNQKIKKSSKIKQNIKCSQTDSFPHKKHRKTSL